MRELKLVGFAGSLREKSYNRALLRTMVELLPLGVTLDVLTIGDLPHYDGDLDQDGERPANVDAFKAAIAASDGVVLVTPEYNHSLPGVFKNAIDWASRPGYRAPFTDKPVAFATASAGPIGGMRAQMHLENVLLGLKARPFPHPGCAVTFAPSKFDEGVLTDKDTRDFVAGYLAEFADWLRERRG